MKGMVFLNTTWMERYEGLNGSDREIHGGGSYIDKYGYGHEIFNFKNINGKVYGYAQPRGYNNLSRLGAADGATYIEDVIVVFTAPHKDGGTYIVGWYKKATFYKNCQYEQIPERKFMDDYFGYYAVADSENATLLSIDERFSFPLVPRRIKGGMGQSNVWYADSPEMFDFKEEVLNQIERHEKKRKRRLQNIISRQADIEMRKKIETIAIGEVTKEFSNRGFTVKSVEAENIGWDLEAVYEKTTLKIEVKGLSGKTISIELTPNEFSNMNEYKNTYRICVVTECINNPHVHVFSFSSERNEWLSEDGQILAIDHIISARCYT